MFNMNYEPEIQEVILSGKSLNVLIVDDSKVIRTATAVPLTVRGMDGTRCLRPYAAWMRHSSVHGRIYSVSQATGPIHVSDGINTAYSRQCKVCRQLSSVNGTAVILFISFIMNLRYFYHL